MPEVPTFIVNPDPRCSHADPMRPFVYCGRRASWCELASSGLVIGFQCSEHRSVLSVEIPSAFLYRRVAVTAQILLAGVDPSAGVSHVEAGTRVAAAAAAIGGTVALQATSSAIGLAEPSRMAQDQRSRRR